MARGQREGWDGQGPGARGGMARGKERAPQVKGVEVKPNLVWSGGVVKAVVSNRVTVRSLPVETLFGELQGFALLSWWPFGRHGQLL